MTAVARSHVGLELLPLAVDLDGTLHRGDLSWWSLRAAVWRNPWKVARALQRPRAAAKQDLAAQVIRHFDAYDLKWNTDFESWLDQQGAMDRPMVLASGSDHEFVRRVAAEFDYFGAVIASDGVTNLTGEAKAERLTAMFPQGFVYAGNSRQDWPVWQAARGAVLVNCSPGLEARARQAFAIEAVFS
ncbi:MAG: hypothetical protein CBC49_008100 [Alphaproteobacteria bacterium TMED89]|nr:hypothetical protein [Rhodospirillaceae bacterium]RPH12491.1 MAG: hypothetical protein CBC49_008100 [Alphaproteobacteria bacterium TMED89]